MEVLFLDNINNPDSHETDIPLSLAFYFSFFLYAVI
jgi:hypothetical protein